MLCRDTLPEESEFQLEAYEAGVRPPSVMTEYPMLAPTPHSASNILNRRRASVTSRPFKPVVLDRMKTSILVRATIRCCQISYRIIDHLVTIITMCDAFSQILGAGKRILWRLSEHDYSAEWTRHQPIHWHRWGSSPLCLLCWACYYALP